MIVPNGSPVTFRSEELVLAGSLIAPPGEGPFPTALLIAGSGPLDRDGDHRKLPLRVSRDLAGFLAEAGWASLRFDKRGVGESEGDYLSTGFWEELTDVEAAWAWLRSRPDVGPIVAIGHSVGASMAAELSARHGDLDGAVLLAATAKTGEETLRWQTQQLKDHLVAAPVTMVLRLFGTSVVKQQAKAVAKLKATTTDTARIQMVKTNAKWMREFIAYDPVPTLRRVQAPVLAITGAKDVQVDPEDLSLIADVTPVATRTLVVDDVDHILRQEPAPISNPRFYRKQIEKPIDARVTTAIAGWLQDLPTRPRRGNGEGMDG